VIGGDNLTQILWIQPRRKCGRLDEIAEHNSQLPSLGVASRRENCGRFASWSRRIGRRHRSAQASDGVEELAAVDDRSDA
jgi:hypothetical protein